MRRAAVVVAALVLLVIGFLVPWWLFLVAVAGMWLWPRLKLRKGRLHAK